MRRYIYFFVIIMFIPALLYSQINETIPSWHWSYEYIDALRLRGGFEELYALNRPYTRGEVAGELVQIQDRILKGAFLPTSFYLDLFDRLKREFQDEMREIRSKNQEARIKNQELRSNEENVVQSPASGLRSPGDYFKVGVRIQADFDKSEDGDAGYKGIYRTKIGVPLGNRVFVYNGITFDAYEKDNPMYVGKKWRGIAGYTEQAYVTADMGRFRFTFGRDFLEWGAGESGTLLFSNVARPLDQFRASARLGPFRYSFVTSVLDEMSVAGGQGSFAAKRYLSAHRLDASLFKGRLQCAVTEAIVYGGENRNIDWMYINPFIFYHGEQLNKSGLGNTLGTVDIVGFPVRMWKLYGSLLIDDIQIEKTGTGDLEPWEVGWIVGSQWADPFGLSGLTLSGEYVRVTNRTYKTPNAWETFIHRNVALGYPLGNDFDHWQIGASQWFFGCVWMKVGYSQTRKGEGSLFTPFDTPWESYSVDEGYSEPFPTGVVERRKELSGQIRFYPSIYWGLEADFSYRWRRNVGHVEGASDSGVVWRVGVWLDGEVGVRL